MDISPPTTILCKEFSMHKSFRAKIFRAISVQKISVQFPCKNFPCNFRAISVQKSAEKTFLCGEKMIDKSTPEERLKVYLHETRIFYRIRSDDNKFCRTKNMEEL
jgi:hypothetical protein